MQVLADRLEKHTGHISPTIHSKYRSSRHETCQRNTLDTLLLLNTLLPLNTANISRHIRKTHWTLFSHQTQQILADITEKHTGHTSPTKHSQGQYQQTSQRNTLDTLLPLNTARANISRHNRETHWTNFSHQTQQILADISKKHTGHTSTTRHSKDKLLPLHTGNISRHIRETHRTHFYHQTQQILSDISQKHTGHTSPTKHSQGQYQRTFQRNTLDILLPLNTARANISRHFRETHQTHFYHQTQQILSDISERHTGHTSTTKHSKYQQTYQRNTLDTLPPLSTARANISREVWWSSGRCGGLIVSVHATGSARPGFESWPGGPPHRVV